MMISHKFYKHCVVPQCRNTTATTSNKLFIYIPQNPDMREKWLKLANINKCYSLNSRVCFCEDHFDAMGRKDSVYHCIKKRKRNNTASLKKAREARLRNRLNEKILKRKQESDMLRRDAIGEGSEQSNLVTDTDKEPISLNPEFDDTPELSDSALPNDMENYMEYHIMGSINKVRMKPNCLPSKFECQSKRKKSTNVPKRESNNFKNTSSKNNFQTSQKILLVTAIPVVTVSTMEIYPISQHSKIPEENTAKINIKQEINSEINEDVQVKTEMDDNEEIMTADNPFANIQLEVKTEYAQSPIADNQSNEESYEVLVHKKKDVDNCTQERYVTEDEKSKLIVPEEVTTNIYDDSIEIKQEEEIEDPYDYDHFDDNQSMSSNDAKAFNNVETCLQEEFKIKCEDETFGINELDEYDKATVKVEYDPTVTETHLIANKLINTTSTVTNPQDGLTKSQTTKTLVMEIHPMPCSASLSKIGNPEEILPTTYNDEYEAMDYDETFQLNSITGNVMTLEQEAYGLLQPKTKTDRVARVYSCTKCPKTYKTAGCLRKHKHVHESIEKRAMGFIKGQKTRKENMKKRMKEEEKSYKTRVKKQIKIESVTLPATQEVLKKEGYECTCGKVFRRRSRMETCLRSHNMCTELGSYFPCVTCSKQFKDKEELSLHRKRLHRKRFPCKFCPTDYNTRKELFKHLQIHQKVQVMEYKVLSEVVKGKQKLKCFMCAKTCTELSELKSHVMDDHKEPYICPHCNGTFSKIIDFGNHTKTYHPEVEGQSVLDVLEAFSKLVKAWKCEECELQFHEADKLAMHQIEKHGPDSKAEPQFQCIDCRRVFISQKGLTSHRRIHHSSENLDDSETVEKGIMCIECRKMCKDSNALTSHMRLHSTERRYPCKFCDFRFATPEKRKAHAELHTGDMKYVCFICEYQCSSENRLKRHKASSKHIGMKEYLATGKLFSEESTSNKPNSPKVDEWVVVKDDDQDESEDSNGGEESTCNICGETFESESKMLRHQDTHPFIEIPCGEDKPTRIFYK